MPRRLAASVARVSGGSPACQPPVPALSMSISPSSPCSRSSDRITPSAVGERQMLPMHTNKIFIASNWFRLPGEPAPQSPRSPSETLQPLHDHRLPHPAGDAHRLEADRAVEGVEVVEQRGHDARAGHPERVAESDRAAERVELLRVDAPLVAARHDLGGEGLVELEDVD